MQRGGGTWRKLRTARASRVRSALYALPPGPFRRMRRARRFWSERAWSEFSAVPAVSQVVRDGAPLGTGHEALVISRAR